MKGNIKLFWFGLSIFIITEILDGLSISSLKNNNTWAIIFDTLYVMLGLGIGYFSEDLYNWITKPEKKKNDKDKKRVQKAK